MIGTPPPNRDRFLAAIAERVAPDRVQALFLFAPIRQGPVETGVAVLAIDQPVPVVVEAVVVEGVTAEGVTAEGVTAEGVTAEGVTAEGVTVAGAPIEVRPVVLTARYRHTLKGADRGKWELEILEQADAPMLTIETVVRGVQQRLDDTAEPERLGAEHLRAALAEGVWTAPQR
jgi:hypothetical protein